MPNEATDILWQPLAGAQTEFLASTARECLLAGSAGSGKTDCLLAAGLSQTGNPRFSGLFLRQTFPQLRDLIARSHELYRPLGANYRQQEHCWYFPSGARLEFSYLDDSAQAGRYQFLGRQFQFLGIDEACQLPADGFEANGESISSTYLFLLTRLRAPADSGLRLECRLTANPLGPGRSWVQARFGIPSDGASSEVVDVSTGYRRQQIQALLASNPHLAADGVYERALRGLPSAERGALLEGRWDSFNSGEMFSWRASMHKRPWHVHPGFRIPIGWPLWRGGDDGWSNPSAIYWMTEDPSFKTLYVIDELYASQLSPDELAHRVLTRDAEIPLQDHFGNPVFNRERLRGTYDSSAFASKGEGEITRGDQMNRLGCKWEQVAKWPGSRVAGVQNFHRLLQPNATAPLMQDANGNALLDGEGKPLRDRPGIVFFARCVNAVRTIPQLLRSERDLEDISDRSSDDAFDGVRYALQHRQSRNSFQRIRLGGV